MLFNYSKDSGLISRQIFFLPPWEAWSTGHGPLLPHLEICIQERRHHVNVLTLKAEFQSIYETLFHNSRLCNVFCNVHCATMDSGVWLLLQSAHHSRRTIGSKANKPCAQHLVRKHLFVRLSNCEITATLQFNKFK